MSLEGRPVSYSALHDQTSVVFPNDLNSYGTLFGGRMMEIADLSTAVVARRHSGCVCVTLGIDSVRFHAPAKRGDVIVLQASINRSWRTSMEIGVKVWAEHFQTRERKHIFSAYFTFVAVDEEMKPMAVPPVIPETDEEKRRYFQAEERRKRRMST